MLRFRLLAALAALAILIPSSVASAQDRGSDDEGLPTIATKTEGMEKRDGFIPLY